LSDESVSDCKPFFEIASDETDRSIRSMLAELFVERCEHDSDTVFSAHGFVVIGPLDRGKLFPLVCNSSRVVRRDIGFELAPLGQLFAGIRDPLIVCTFRLMYLLKSVAVNAGYLRANRRNLHVESSAAIVFGSRIHNDNICNTTTTATNAVPSGEILDEIQTPTITTR
jgi:hypothetical protein